MSISYDVETKLDEADRAAELDDVRYTEEQVFGRVKERLIDSLRNLPEHV
ncbi:MAG: hypothetical protein LUC30_05485 [Clostridiales bacterium]|nr:hypothetical protein [Clostridiales bacterium]MCD8382355.1 hypothetical protein [Clostridiales bacterium]